MAETVFPIFLKTHHRACLVVGGGTVAWRKINRLLDAGVRVDALSPIFDPEITRLARERSDLLTLEYGAYSSRELTDYLFVIAATDNETVNRVVAGDASRARVPVNVVDSPELSSFYFPAIVQRGTLQIAVGTSGVSPALSQRIRRELEQSYPEYYAVFTAALGRVRGWLSRACPDTAIRRRALKILTMRDRDGALAGLDESAMFDVLRREASDLIAAGAREPSDQETRHTGICYLVGAGPGDVELITVRGLKCLRRADVVFYDYLVNTELLNEIPGHARAICVGKKPGDTAMKQDAINRRVIEAVRSGKTVVRLKGGDPFVFGRGGEEAVALADAGLRFEVVPGVTAGIAAPARAGIPVTHRDITGTVVLLTGHKKTGSRHEIDWDAIGQLDGTLCIYMGVHRIGEISKRLMAAGRSKDEPVAVIENATLNQQRCLTGTLETIADVMAQHHVEPPAIIVVGSVVRLRNGMSFERSQQRGKK